MKSPTVFQPENTQELSEFLKCANSVRIAGYWNDSTTGSKLDADIELSGNSGIIDFSPSDQVVKLHSGTTIGQLNSELGKARQVIPIFMSNEGEPWGAWGSLTIADCIAWNLPHGLEFQHGSWRDWILGATIVVADGMTFKSGSSVVKSVAGYDIHRLIVGARHTLGVIAEVILRTTPISTLKQSEITIQGSHEKNEHDAWRIHRCLRTDWEAMKQTLKGSLTAFDSLTCTTYCHLADNEPVRFQNDWIIETGLPAKHLNDVQAKYMRRAKHIFDPTGKLNPGAMGIF